MFDDRSRAEIVRWDESKFLAETHFGLGMWMRNNWRLWRNSKLSRYFNGLGIYHTDDMSSIILQSFYRKLKGDALNLDKQVNYYKEYWEKQKKKKD